jgi:superfamily II DNA helicase RecQ
LEGKFIYHILFTSQTCFQALQDGKYTIIIVQPEQLQSFEGHLPRLAQALRNRHFVKLIRRVYVDEAHTIYTSGIPLYGLPAFRPAWGSLGQLRLALAKDTPCQALSGTFPDHIIKCVVDKLLFPSDYVTISLTSNRPNITYATHPISGSLNNFGNLQFLIPDTQNEAFDIHLIPKTLIFHDDREEAANAARFLNNLLPETMRLKRISKHYHSLMSDEYLEQTFRDFAASDGTTRILCATSGASTVSVRSLMHFCSHFLFVRVLMCQTLRALSSTEFVETSQTCYREADAADGHHRLKPCSSLCTNRGP